MWGAIVAMIGLGALLSFAQSSRVGFANRLSAYLGVLQIPAAISVLWYLGNEFGWWTVAIFVGASLIVGTLNGIAAKGRGRATLVQMQPVTGPLFVAGAIVCWLIPAAY